MHLLHASVKKFHSKTFLLNDFVVTRLLFGCSLTPLHFISSSEPKAHGELIVYQSSRRLCLCVCVFTFSNRYISATKFYLKQHWVGGKDALGFGQDWIRTLVSMATDSSHRVIMGKT